MLFRALFLAILALNLVSCSKKPVAEVAPKPLFVKCEQAVLAPIKQEFETAGELKADREILVAAERQGQIEQIFVYEGEWVKDGQALIKVKGEDVDADLAKAQADYESYIKLFEQGAISKQELLQYETVLKRIESQRDNLMITAITAGVVGQIYVDPGDYVKLGDSILDLVKVYPLRVSYTIPEKLISKVNIGQQVTLSADSYPGRVFNAIVDFISPKVEQATRTVLIRARITNPANKLKANQFVRVRQVIDNLDNAILVLEQAIHLEQGQEFIYLAEAKPQDSKSHKPKAGNPNGPPPATHTATRVAVKTGLREDGKVQILEGVELGDSVIYAGLHSIYPGANLVIVEE